MLGEQTLWPYSLVKIVLACILVSDHLRVAAESQQKRSKACVKSSVKTRGFLRNWRADPCGDVIHVTAAHAVAEGQFSSTSTRDCNAKEQETPVKGT